MEKIEEIVFNAKALLKFIKTDQKFFNAVVFQVEELVNLLDSEEINWSKVKFCFNQIDLFYEKWREKKISSGVLYFAPRQISDSDVLVVGIRNILEDSTINLPKKSFEPASSSKVTSLNEYIKDNRLLMACNKDFESKNYWDSVFKATRHLETRIREKAQLSNESTGVDLVKQAFHNQTGKLKVPFCETESEREGFFQILVGVTKYHRNSKAHREGKLESDLALKIIGYVDYLITVVDNSIENKTD